MIDPLGHDRLVAKLQHFADTLKFTQQEKESCLLSFQHKSHEKESLKTQIFLYEEILKEYYDTFEDILHR